MSAGSYFYIIWLSILCVSHTSNTRMMWKGKRIWQQRKPLCWRRGWGGRGRLRRRSNSRSWTRSRRRKLHGLTITYCAFASSSTVPRFKASKTYVVSWIRVCSHTRNLDLALLQVESRGGAAEEGRREGEEGLHQEWVFEEEAAQTDGGHGRGHQAAIWKSQEEAAAQVHPPGRYGAVYSTCESHRWATYNHIHKHTLSMCSSHWSMLDLSWPVLLLRCRGTSSRLLGIKCFFSVAQSGWQRQRPAE